MPEQAQATAATEDAQASEERAAVEELATAFGKEVPKEEPAEEPPVETVTEEPPAEETQPEEPAEDETPPAGSDLHKLQSWMGRKQAKWAEEQETRLKGLLDSYFVKPTPPAEEKVEIPDIGEDLDAIVTTKREVLETISQMTAAEKKKSDAYWGGYSNTLGELARNDKLNPDEIKAVAIELDQNLKNPISHSDPKISARLNYQTALLNVIRRKPAPAEKKLPGANQKPISATGVITSQKTDVKPEVPVNLDSESKRLAKVFGLTDDKIKTILKK